MTWSYYVPLYNILALIIVGVASLMSSLLMIFLFFKDVSQYTDKFIEDIDFIQVLLCKGQ